MGRLSDAYSNSLLDVAFGAAAPEVAATYSVGLSTTAPTNDGSNVNEPVGNGYARVDVANTATNWPPASGRIKSNGVEIAFSTASGSWGTVTHFVMYDELGVFCAWGTLNSPQTVDDGNTPSFPIGALVIDAPGT